MGNQLDQGIRDQGGTAEQVWRGVHLATLLVRLDTGTADFLKAITTRLSCEPEIYALILFGSVARYEERPVTDSEPSDVDVLVLIDPGTNVERLPLARDVELRMLIGVMSDRFRHAAREVQFTFAQRDLAGWDPLFVANVARDGILLWTRGPLTDRLAPIAERAAKDSQGATPAT